MEDPGIAKKLVDALVAGLPDGRPDLRPVHAYGVGATGYFEASDIARNFSVAEHFLGHRVPVTVRFSNGSGSSVQRDGRSDVRGMAARFHLAGGAATDLIAMTLGEFFTPTPETFLKFAEETTPGPVAREPPWRKLLDMLRLMLPLPDPYPGQTLSPVPGAMKFADENDYARLAVFHGAALGAPVSYARAAYHAVHTFVVVAPDGSRKWVRFKWQPVDGVLTTDTKTTPVDDYLKQELRDRVANSPPRFILSMAIGQEGDDFDDPSRPWPPHRRRIMMGTLTIDAVPDDQITFCERLSFNPLRLTPGIEPSNDPVLWVRREAYEYSRQRRGGASCPFSGS